MSNSALMQLTYFERLDAHFSHKEYRLIASYLIGKNTKEYKVIAFYGKDFFDRTAIVLCACF